MNMLVRSLDRIATGAVGVVLLVGGLVAFAWDRRLLIDWPAALDLDGPLAWLRQSWVPWVAGIGGGLVALAALWWLIAHIPARRVHAEPLAGSGAAGQLRIDLRTVASRAADDVARLPGVTGCRGRALRDRGQLVIELRPTLAAETDLAAFGHSVDVAAATARQVLTGTAVAIRVRTHVDRPR